MTTRKVADFACDAEESLKKRQRITERPTASLESLNGDCLLTILSYLSMEDLNSVAICSRRYRRARAHESLDQTRSGTIVITNGCTLWSLSNKIIGNNWNQVFQGNRTHLKIEGLERLPLIRLSSMFLLDSQGENRMSQAALSGVVRLEMPFTNTPVSRYDLSDFPRLFPNLTSANLSSVALSRRDVFSFFRTLFQHCPNIADLELNDCSGTPLNGFHFRSASHLSRLHLDDCCFHVTEIIDMDEFSDMTNNERYPFQICQRLERLSIKNATWTDFSNPFDDAVHPVSQELLIKLTRRHPTLRWLRSDLSPENVAMLQQERPDMTFVSE